MDNQTIITVVTTITGAVVTIVGIVIKDRADQRRWEREQARNNLQHAENRGELQAIHTEVNGKMDKVISVALSAGLAEGIAAPEGREGP